MPTAPLYRDWLSVDHAASTPERPGHDLAQLDFQGLDNRPREVRAFPSGLAKPKGLKSVPGEESRFDALDVVN